MLAHLLNPRGSEQRDRVVMRCEPELDVQGLPGVRGVVFGDAIRELSRISQGGHVDLAGERASQVGDHELERPSDRAVRTGGIAEQPRPAVEAQARDDLAADDR